jgi:FkbM family methyltransferase
MMWRLSSNGRGEVEYQKGEGSKTESNMLDVVRTLIKKPLNVLGVDVVRYRPQYALGPYAYLKTFNLKTVIDAGAHTGEFARMIKELLPDAAVISFEPLPASFRQLESSMRDVAGFRAFNYALGESEAVLEMHHNDYSQSSSLLPMADLHREAFPETARETIETVEVRRLDDVLAGIALEPGVLVKIDVQGYEDKVIAGGEQTISRAKALIIEVSFQKLYEGQPLFHDIYQSLTDRGFTFMGHLYQLLNPTDGSILQADALFVKQ